ncbi:MAG: phosphatase PAP2 family protein [Ilumatobacteraceae bacterium]
MRWVTWDQAAISATVTGGIALYARRNPRTRFLSAVGSAATELTLLELLYTIWRLARVLPLDKPSGAIERGRQINQFQHNLHFPSELSLQHFVLDHEWLARLTNYYYAIAHVPGLVLFLFWIYIRHRDAYPHWRNGLVILTAFCLVIRFIRVAPPRFFPELGYIDLASRFGMSVYGPVGTGVSDQFAAMPSIHVGWAAVVSFGIVAAGTSRWRWLFLLHLVLTMIAVSATGNHWWLDGIAAIILLGVALFVDSYGRRLFKSRISVRPSRPLLQ